MPVLESGQTRRVGGFRMMYDGPASRGVIDPAMSEPTELFAVWLLDGDPGVSVSARGATLDRAVALACLAHPETLRQMDCGDWL